MSAISEKVRDRIQQVDAEIARLQGTRDKLRVIQEAGEDVDLGRWLEGLFSAVETTSFDRIKPFLRQRGMAGASIDEMATEAVVSESAIRQIVYGASHKDSFRKVGRRGRKVLFGLTE